jgi:hypothetical protein
VGKRNVRESQRELAHEARYGINCGEAMIEWDGWQDASESLKAEAINLWRYAGLMYGCLIDGKDVPDPGFRGM